MASSADEAASQDVFWHAQLPAEQVGLFRKVLAALTAGQVRFAVAGAFAFQRYTGIWRFTKDLDLFLPAAEVERALSLCREQGFLTEVRDPVWLAKAWHEEYYVDFISGMSNGVLWVTDEWIERSPKTSVLGVETRLLAPAQMLLSKLFVTRRDRFDGSDIAHLIYCTGPEMDWHDLIRVTEDFWEILLWHLLLFHYVYPNERTRVPAWVWQQLTGRLQASLRATEPVHPGFRGTLIDERMFDADVDQWGLEDLQTGLRQRRLHEIASGGRAA